MKPTTPAAAPSPAKRKFRDSSEALAAGSELQGTEGLLDTLPRLAAGHELRQGHPRGLASAQGHELDEADVPALLLGPAGHLDHVRLVVVTGDHAVELEGPQVGFPGGGDAGLDLGQGAEPHELLETLGVEGVHVDVDPAQARLLQGAGEARQQDRVRGHGHVAHAGERGDAPHDVEDVGAQGRLAAGEAELPEAEREGRPGHGLDLGRGEQLGGGDEAQAAQGHAVDAPQVAVVDDGDAEVVDLATEAVFRHAGIFLEGGSANGGPSRPVYSTLTSTLHVPTLARIYA